MQCVPVSENKSDCKWSHHYEGWWKTTESSCYFTHLMRKVHFRTFTWSSSSVISQPADLFYGREDVWFRLFFLLWIYSSNFVSEALKVSSYISSSAPIICVLFWMVTFKTARWDHLFVWLFVMWLNNKYVYFLIQWACCVAVQLHVYWPTVQQQETCGPPPVWSYIQRPPIIKKKCLDMTLIKRWAEFFEPYASLFKSRSE